MVDRMTVESTIVGHAQSLQPTHCAGTNFAPLESYAAEVETEPESVPVGNAKDLKPEGATGRDLVPEPTDASEVI